jgi:hypothetical protein
MHHVTAIFNHDHKPTILSNTLFASMPMQIMHYATAKKYVEQHYWHHGHDQKLGNRHNKYSIYIICMIRIIIEIHMNQSNINDWN